MTPLIYTLGALVLGGIIVLGLWVILKVIVMACSTPAASPHEDD